MSFIFRLAPERQQEIAAQWGAVRLDNDKLEALQAECAVIGHRFILHADICSYCGWEKK